MLSGITLAAAAFSTSAGAQNIDTTAAWNGTSSISPWGLPDTATYGQTITATPLQNRLTSFTFELGQTSGVTPQYQAFVYQWNAVNQRIVGPALFTSGVLTAPGGGTFTPVTINTGLVSLTAGQQYVLFFTTSSVAQAGSASYRYGALSNNTGYPGGQFVFENNTANFSALSTTTWSTIAEDLAFMAQFGGLLVPLLPTGSPVNPTNVASAIDGFSNGGGTVPAAFNNLYMLSGQQLTAALSQLSGEAATGAQDTSFELTNSFMSLLTGPSGSTSNGSGPALPFAPDRAQAFPADVALAYASVLKAPPRAFTPHWNSWGAAFGGGSTTSGDPSGVGSHDVSAHTGAVAAGIDYQVAPDTIVGLALAGGSTSWSLSAGMGGGRSDAFLGGLYGSTHWGQSYLSGALTYGSYWMSTSRTIAVAGADTLSASFLAQNLGARLEGGYRIPSALTFSITPYAALQAQSFRMPAYSESGSLGAPDPMALSYASQTATVVRSELGGRFDQVYAQAAGSSVDLFGRVAWAHDWQSTPNLSATFIGLPTATFVVNGAAPPKNLALLTVGAEWRWRNGWSAMGKLDGELAGGGSNTYSGTAQVKYSW